MKIPAAIHLSVLLVGLTHAPALPQADEPSTRYVCPPCAETCHDGDEAAVFEAPGTCPVAACGMTLIKESGMRTVAIVLWNGVELLDFAGPGEVFAVAQGPDGAAFRVVTVASTKDPILSQGFVSVVPQHSVADVPDVDLIVLPGGGVSQATEDAALMGWLQGATGRAEHVLSVCTGAYILADLGLLDGLAATTWHGALEGLAERAPEADVQEGKRFIDNGKVITTAGVSAGIDGALHTVEKLLGKKAARDAAAYMEYDWRFAAARGE